MKNLIMPALTKTNLPAQATYGTMDIVGKTFGRYFDNKRDIALVRHETVKVLEQGKVLRANIDAELCKSLDSNQKNFDIEIARLKCVCDELCSGHASREKVYIHIDKLTSMLSDAHVEQEVKMLLPALIASAYGQLSDANRSQIQTLNHMNGFDPETKLLGGK